ncbi:protocatechuate dioxygenase [Actinomadura graeca]|uniref:Protocatechuate dioxygenase n=1 Tax=Actinomadura graeca TaxID=2750812 RepID=A0ABX8QWL2_9ACTN|nr:hypothetical protein [Actinomadura graeca]QXJ21158.1 protocatechuate dioxygenase [Actinomadura graeca]
MEREVGAAREDEIAAALLDRSPRTGPTPGAIDGPYWFDVDLVRADLREDRRGLETRLVLRVLETRGGETGPFRGVWGVAPPQETVPVHGAMVEVWHCDAAGVYSGFEEISRMEIPIPMGDDGLPAGPMPGGDAGPSDGSYSRGEPESTRTDDATYLRGAQPTDASGIARFTTIYPGWYVSRTSHVHVKVHRERRNVLTAQLYLDDGLSDEIHTTVAPYTDHVARDTRNETDFLFTPECRLEAERHGDRVIAAIDLVLGPEAVPGC